MGERVVVVGGGIGGLTTALALAHHGIPVTVHERAPELQEIGAGLGVWPAPLRVFDRLGIGDAVRDLGCSWEEAGLRRADGRFLIRYTAAQFSDRLGEPTIGVHRGELQALLVRSLDPDVIRTGSACTGLTQRANGVTVRFEHGPSVEADVVVGADGRRSIVRRELFGDQPLRDRRTVGWRGTALAPPASDWHRSIGETWGPGGRFGLLPISGGRVTWYAAARRLRADGGLEELLDRFGGWHDPIPELLAATEPSQVWVDACDDRRPLWHWGKGRVTLLGDAAHPMTPDLGQGACQAILDAWVLAEELSRSTDAAALRAYERRRRWRAGAVTMVARAATAGARPESRAAVTLRSRMAALAPPSLALRQLDLITRGP